jgi:uncharacterized protein YbcV (DUF1398 family)
VFPAVAGGRDGALSPQFQMVFAEGFKRNTGNLHGHRTHVGHQESVTSFCRGFWENGVFKKVHEVDVTRDRHSLVRLRVDKRGEKHHAMEFLTAFWQAERSCWD